MRGRAAPCLNGKGCLKKRIANFQTAFSVYPAESRVGCVAPRRRTRSPAAVKGCEISATACVAEPHTLP
ncbi:hypothetical protein [Kingella potus]|uniref:hypothetical protein n=1 Tax=Kingella potus TaxID=265175 RepID=UPI001FD402EE|nr:hypothetical protein [Kingella potus]UOP01075.1 hypothetical protein LVJ84_01575 [Kingella potus]